MVLGALELLFEVEKGGGGPFWEFNPLFIFYLIYTFFRPICVPNQPKNAPGPYDNNKAIFHWNKQILKAVKSHLKTGFCTGDNDILNY